MFLKSIGMIPYIFENHNIYKRYCVKMCRIYAEKQGLSLKYGISLAFLIIFRFFQQWR